MGPRMSSILGYYRYIDIVSNRAVNSLNDHVVLERKMSESLSEES